MNASNIILSDLSTALAVERYKETERERKEESRRGGGDISQKVC